MVVSRADGGRASVLVEGSRALDRWRGPVLAGRGGGGSVLVIGADCLARGDRGGDRASVLGDVSSRGAARGRPAAHRADAVVGGGCLSGQPRLCRKQGSDERAGHARGVVLTNVPTSPGAGRSVASGLARGGPTSRCRTRQRRRRSSRG